MSAKTTKKSVKSTKTVKGDFLANLKEAMAAVGESGKMEEAVLSAAIARFGGDHGQLFEFESTTGGLRAVASFGTVEDMLSKDMRIFAQYATDHPLDPASVIIAPDVKDVQKLSARKSVRRKMTTEVILIPLASGGQSVGVLYLGSKKKGAIKFSGVNPEKALIVGGILGEAMGFKKTIRQLELQNKSLQKKINKVASSDCLFGTSEAIDRVRKAVDLVATTEIPVTLIGEKGVKKETIAEFLHGQSDRKKKPFVMVSVSETPQNMLDKVVFGEASGKGTRGRKGALKEATGGTLYIDGIDQMATTLQKQLVDAIESGSAIGAEGKKAYPVDVRMIMTTGTDPKTLYTKKQIHKSLYLKMALFPIMVPPLRDRLEDLPLLVNHQVKMASSEFGKRLAGINAEVYDYLGSWSWDGNLEELENEIRHAVLRTPDKRGVLNMASLSPHLVGQKKPMVVDTEEGTLKQRVARIEKRMIIEALENNGHNQSLTAEQLGLSRQALINKLHRYGIETGRKYKRKMREIAKLADSEE